MPDSLPPGVAEPGDPGAVQSALQKLARWEQTLLSRPVAIETLPVPAFRQAGVQVSVWREDQRDPRVSGNKLHKLRYHLRAAVTDGANRIISFGGAWSNHLHALGHSCRQLDIPLTVIVRGDPPTHPSPTLQDLAAWGVERVFWSREHYRRRQDPATLHDLCMAYPGAYLVPEGGGGPDGVRGCADWGRLLARQAVGFDRVMLAVGTGATLAGLSASLPENSRLTGVSVLKGITAAGFGIDRQLEEARLTARVRREIETGFHGGGYARWNADYRAFWDAWDHRVLPLDPVYTGKLVWAAVSLAQRGVFRRGERVLLVHTGGLQGRRPLVRKSMPGNCVQ